MNRLNGSFYMCCPRENVKFIRITSILYSEDIYLYAKPIKFENTNEKKKKLLINYNTC